MLIYQFGAYIKIALESTPIAIISKTNEKEKKNTISKNNNDIL